MQMDYPTSLGEALDRLVELIPEPLDRGDLGAILIEMGEEKALLYFYDPDRYVVEMSLRKLLADHGTPYCRV